MGKIKANITISKDSRDVIRVRIQDNVSRISFMEFEMGLAEFTQAITGLACVEGIAEVRGLEYVGKVKVVETREAVMPINSYCKKEQQQWMEENCQEDGWTLDTYLGSQNSTSSRDGKTVLRYSVYKYVEETESEDE